MWLRASKTASIMYMVFTYKRAYTQSRHPNSYPFYFAGKMHIMHHPHIAVTHLWQNRSAPRIQTNLLLSLFSLVNLMEWVAGVQLQLSYQASEYMYVCMCTLLENIKSKSMVSLNFVSILYVARIYTEMKLYIYIHTI